MLSALGVLSTEHSVQSNPSALSALSTEMHHQNKTLSTKCCHPHGHSVLSTSTVCAPEVLPHTKKCSIFASLFKSVLVAPNFHLNRTEPQSILQARRRGVLSWICTRIIETRLGNRFVRRCPERKHDATSTRYCFAMIAPRDASWNAN